MCVGKNCFKLMPRVILICSCIKKKNVVYETNYSIEQPIPKVVKSNLRKKISLLSTVLQSKSLQQFQTILIVNLFSQKSNQVIKWFVKGKPTCPERSSALKPAYKRNTIWSILVSYTILTQPLRLHSSSIKNSILSTMDLLQ